MPAKLKPCPFCGNAAPEVVITHSEGCGDVRYKVFCFFVRRVRNSNIKHRRSGLFME